MMLLRLRWPHRGFSPRRLVSMMVMAALAVAALPGVAYAHHAVPSGFSQAAIAFPTAPTAMEFAPDGRLFISEQTGSLRVVKDGAMLPTPFLTLDVDAQGERGLLGIAFDPDFATNQWVYVYYTAKTPTVHNRVSRFTAEGDAALPGSEVVLVDLPTLGALQHNGGDIHFGPDGKLYVPTGDNGIPANAPQLTNPFGKILRFNRDGSIPTDNPFYGSTSGVNRAIWALGLRNPFTSDFQPGTGRYFINDVGDRTWEEVNEGMAGANYGWPTLSGPSSDPRFKSPVHAYMHEGDDSETGCAVTGGAFYNPVTPRFPAQYVGKYFFGDYCNGWIRQLNPSNGQDTSFATGFRFMVDLEVSDDGDLFVLSRAAQHPAQVTRISYNVSEPPEVTAHPVAETVAIGDPVSFTVSALGTPPLAYQWQRNGVNIPGATQATFTINSASASDDQDVFRARVSNGFGSALSDGALLRVLDNEHPVATITSPVEGLRYDAGQTVNFSGSATDAEDGALPDSAFTWEVVFHHDDHVHPFRPPTSGQSGSFVVPTVGEVSANVFYRIHLTVTDSVGLSHHVFRDVAPNTVALNLASSPSGLRLTLDGQPVTTPFSVDAVVGMTRQIGALSPQDKSGSTWEFGSWSDGGDATHEITLASSPVTYTASFVEASRITFRSSTANSAAFGINSLRIEKPPGTQAGDVMVASIVVNDDDPALLTPSGWTLVRQATIPGELRHAVYTRVATASETRFGTWRLESDFRRIAGGIASYVGVDTAMPVNVSAALVDATPDTEVVAPSVDASVALGRVLHLVGMNAEGSISPPAGMLERFEVLSPNLGEPRDALAEGSDVALGSSGPTGARTATASEAGAHIGMTVVLRPAGGPPPPPPPGEIGFVGSATGGSPDGRRSLVIPRPAGTASGDVLVASIVVNDDDPALLTPAGWTLVREGTINDRLRHAVFVRVAGGSEPGSYTWDLTGSWRRLAGGIATYRGVDTTSPVDASGVVVDDTPDTEVVAPSVDATVAGGIVLHLVGINAEGSISPPAGMTERFEVSSPNTTEPRDALAEGSDAALGSSGPTGARTATASQAGAHIGITLVLRPAS